MWLKLILCALIITFCVFLGYFAAGKYRSRKKFYTQFALFNERYLNELSFTRRPLTEWLRGNDYTGDFAKTVHACVSERNISCRYAFLSKEEQKECTDYFSMLGTGDSGSQKNYFSAQKGLLEEKKSSSEREAKARGDLYLKLGLLAGLAFVILIL